MSLLPAPRSIVLVRALALGDLLCAIPALRALRAAAPGARISLVGLPWAAELPDRFPAYLDEHLPFPGFPGIPEAPVDPDRIRLGLAALQARRFDLALGLHGEGPVSSIFTRLLGARRTVAFRARSGSLLDPGLEEVPFPAGAHEIGRCLALVEAIGVEPRGDALEFPLRPSDGDELAAALGGERLGPGDYAVVHPGASVPERRWKPAQFAAVADRLAERGLRVVLTGGDREAEVTLATRTAMQAPALDLTGRTTLGALGALVDGAAIVVSNDTGVGHLAVARGTPSVRVFVASEPFRWRPLDAERHRAVVPAGLGDDGVPRGLPATVASVLAAVDDVLTAAAVRAGAGSGAGPAIRPVEAAR